MAALVAIVMAVVLASPAWAANLAVETASDEQPNLDGECSLREAVINANHNDQSGSSDCPAGGGGDRIVFDLGDPPATTTLASRLPPITDVAGLTVDGVASDITISGNNAVRVFEVGVGAKLALNGLTVADGDSASGLGGGILNRGTLTVSNSTLSGNSASSGGGIYNSRSATVSSSTLSGNSASNSGGGIYNHDQGALLEVSNSTLSGNGAGQSGGGIEHSDGSARLRNTIVANSPSGGDCHWSVTPVTDGGYNLDSDGTCNLATGNRSRPDVDPLLDPLADNGGPTLTHALRERSPAVDKGDSFGATADQRGLPRPTDLGAIPNATGGDGSDIGAYEQVLCSGDVVNAAGTVIGTPGPDVLRGGEGNDTIFGLGGNDRISGLGGNDDVCSGKGNDTLLGGEGDDTLLGGEGKDILHGGPGRDDLLGLRGDDRLDTIDGVRRNDLADGGPGQDVCRRTDPGDTKASCR
jgi:Ca2+-binding RTX toxin-like protein